MQGVRTELVVNVVIEALINFCVMSTLEAQTDRFIITLDLSHMLVRNVLLPRAIMWSHIFWTSQDMLENKLLLVMIQRVQFLNFWEIWNLTIYLSLK